MPTETDLQLAKFLRAVRGDVPRLAFGRRIGVSESTVFRLESGEQSATLSLVDGILKRLRFTPADVFGGAALPAVHETPARYAVRPRPRKSPRKPRP